MKLSVIKLGFARGLTSALFYLGCAIVMLVNGQEGSVRFFNSLFHGIDVFNIIRMEMPVWEAVLGIFQFSY